MARRPSVLTPEMKLSENVKYIIKDRQDKTIVGVVMIDDQQLMIEFFAEVSPIIVFNKKNMKFDIDAELYTSDPKVVINRILKK